MLTSVKRQKINREKKKVEGIKLKRKSEAVMRCKGEIELERKSKKKGRIGGRKEEKKCKWESEKKIKRKC